MLLILCLSDDSRALGVADPPDISNVVTLWASSSESFILFSSGSVSAGSIWGVAKGTSNF